MCSQPDDQVTGDCCEREGPQITEGLQVPHIHFKHRLYSASQTPLSFSDFYRQTVGIFSPNFTRLSYISMYAGLQNSITGNFDEVMSY